MVHGVERDAVCACEDVCMEHEIFYVWYVCIDVSSRRVEIENDEDRM